MSVYTKMWTHNGKEWKVGERVVVFSKRFGRIAARIKDFHPRSVRPFTVSCGEEGAWCMPANLVHKFDWELLKP